MSWTCSHGYTFSDFEMECGMTFGTMDYLMVKANRTHNLEADRDQEIRLAREFLSGELDCPWPSYADDIIEIQEPEIFYV